MKMCTHTEHCCVKHGCKYFDCDCPVWLGIERQSYPCEQCGWDIEEIDVRQIDNLIAEFYRIIGEYRDNFVFMDCLQEYAELQLMEYKRKLFSTSIPTVSEEELKRRR